MKTINTLSSITLFLIVAFTACKKDNDTAPISSTVANLTTSLTQGKWHVTSFSENNSDKTSDVKDYSFQFTSTNIFAVKATEKDTAVWSSKTQNVLSIDFGVSPNVSELNNEWTIVQINSTLLQLTHVDTDDDSKTAYVTFHKL